jgi:ornithine decarboxylase
MTNIIVITDNETSDSDKNVSHIGFKTGSDMTFQNTHWHSPLDFLASKQPDRPVAFFRPEVLRQTCERFKTGFAGNVSFAVKANPSLEIVSQLVASGLRDFDVASPEEIKLVRDCGRNLTLHYNNPVRSRSEIAFAVAQGVRSFSVDRISEMDKLLAAIAPSSEIFVRLALDLDGAAYNFGEKFGATANECVAMLRRISETTHTASMTFHPGTQCNNPDVWEAYILTIAQICRDAGVHLNTLNVGGGFPSDRGNTTTVLEDIFAAIETSWIKGFGNVRPTLLCEPGRAMVADAFSLCVRIKSRSEGTVFLNDGIYGDMCEFRDIGHCDRYRVHSPEGVLRSGNLADFVAFGPTCDSLDKLPNALRLPDDCAEEDYVLIEGMGAYANCISTRFNGYGDISTVIIE